MKKVPEISVIKRYAISTGMTFLSGFLLELFTWITTASQDDFTLIILKGVVIGALLSGLRLALKMPIEKLSGYLDKK